ncbi:MAG TPA: hypothetical protein VN224_14090 [Xanthomonadales bacterium]|nr:hypothetical protein [Xanthomonadales bacterium]
MRRTPPWVFVAAAGIELAVLLLCAWGMEQSRFADAEEPAPFGQMPEPEALPPAEPEPPRIVQMVAPLPPGPMFGPPPVRPPEADDLAPVPAFLVEPADATTQIVGGKSGDGRLAFGFYADGNMRFVDTDGGRYAGKVENARARMREVDGTRAFTVQIGVAADQRLQATFTGGAHDAETIALEPLVGWSVA